MSPGIHYNELPLYFNEISMFAPHLIREESFRAEELFKVLVVKSKSAE